MNNGKGRIVTFKDKDGIERRGVAYYKNQLRTIAEQGKVVITETTDDGKNKKHNGREVMHMKPESEIKVIGFTD